MYCSSVFVCLLASSSLATAFVSQQRAEQWSIGSSGQTLARSEEDVPPPTAFVQGGEDPAPSPSTEPYDVAAMLGAAAAKAAVANAQPATSVNAGTSTDPSANSWDQEAVMKAAAEEAAADTAAEAKNSGSPSPALQTENSGAGGGSTRYMDDSSPVASPTVSADAGAASTPTKSTGPVRCALILPQYHSGPGNCPAEFLTEGQMCEPQCGTGYAVSGIIECKDGLLRQAVCQDLPLHAENTQPQVIVVPPGSPIPNQQEQGTNTEQLQPSNPNQVNQPQDQQVANAAQPQDTTVGTNNAAEDVSFKPVETSEPVPLGHIIAVLAGALVLIMAPAIYVKSQGGKKKDADVDAEDDGNAGAEEGIASEKGSQAGSEGSKVPLAEAAI